MPNPFATAPLCFSRALDGNFIRSDEWGCRVGQGGETVGCPINVPGWTMVGVPIEPAGGNPDLITPQGWGKLATESQNQVVLSSGTYLVKCCGGATRFGPESVLIGHNPQPSELRYAATRWPPDPRDRNRFVFPGDWGTLPAPFPGWWYWVEYDFTGAYPAYKSHAFFNEDPPPPGGYLTALAASSVSPRLYAGPFSITASSTQTILVDFRHYTGTWNPGIGDGSGGCSFGLYRKNGS